MEKVKDCFRLEALIDSDGNTTSYSLLAGKMLVADLYTPRSVAKLVLQVLNMTILDIGDALKDEISRREQQGESDN